MQREMPHFGTPLTLKFAPSALPAFGGEGAKKLDVDCCPEPDCPQRDFNRAVSLLLDRMAQAYAAYYLVQEATTRVWPCGRGDPGGHAEGCDDPACTFAGDMRRRLEYAREWFEGAVIRLFRTLTVPSLDLEGEWNAFGVNEIAGRASSSPLDPMFAEALETLRQETVGWDRVAYERWFRPPPEGDDPDAP